MQISAREAGALFALFWAQFVIGAFVPASAHGAERVVVAALYLVLGAAVLLRDRGRLGRLFRDGFVAPYARLAEPVR